MPSLFEQAGSTPQKQARWVPIFMDRCFTGLYTQRSALHDPSDVITSKFYGGRPDAIWRGLNVELTNRLSLQRRPGLSPFSTATYAEAPDRAYSFQLTDGTIRVIIDTGSTGLLTVTSVGAPSGGQAIYTGTFPCGAANAFVGLEFTIAGFTNGPNNGTFLVIASDATTLTLENPNAISESHAATAISYGATYWDQQNGSKTLLFVKSPGAGQSYFQGVAGILYVGNGVDTWKWTPLNPNLPPGGSVSVWKWGIVAPTEQPSVTSVASGSAAIVWQANSIFSTMGLTIDQFGQVWQLIGVNADLTNSPNAQFGTAGNGNPPWNQALYGQTTESSGTPIVWQNLGQLQPWAAHTQYGDAGTNGVAAPVGIFDSTTSSIYFNFRNSGGLGTSGATKPAFNGVAGSSFFDGSCHWFFIGKYTDMQPWKATHSYLHWYAGAGTRADILSPQSLVIEPFLFPPPDPTVQAIYVQVPTNTGTSGNSYAPFPNPVGPPIVNSGFQQPDGQLLWMNLGSGTWKANTIYIQWQAQGTPFGCVYDGTNMQVATNPSAVASPRSGNTIPTFGANYGDHSTLDGDIVWICVGPPVAWVAGTATTGIWNLPPSGFQPPQTSQAYGGSIIDSNTSLVEATIVSGKSGTVQPTWGALGTNTGDPGAALVLTSVAVVGPVTTYNGTITGGGANAFAGFTFLFAGFSNQGNNGNFKIVSSTTTTLVVATTTQISETRAATATTGLVWFAESQTSSQSLSWKIGLAYAYSFKARAFDDFYSPLPLGGGNIPPGSTFGALGPPTGSATNAVSTASPAFIITGANAGAVNTITGLGSTDPQVDTIIIWRSADGGGDAQMFELTEIPAPKPIGGVAQPWTFRDFLPDTATSVFPGLNFLIPAPIDDVNDPPFPSFLPMVYNFQRIWGADGENVEFSGGPDTETGNPNEAFPPLNSMPFLAPVVRIVKTPQGLVTFLTDSIEIIGGGPLTSSFFSVTWAPGIGLMSYNALDILAGDMYFFSADNQFRIMTPSLNVANAGFALGDQFANLPSSGVSDATWDPSKVYVASHQNGIDNCIFVADGSTGWYRLNAHQAGANPNTEPVWSPFAAITGGCKMVQSVETAPGVKKLLVGATTCNQEILYRNLSLYTDNGTPYDAFFVMGSIMLCHPGQLALLKFCEFDFSGVSYRPTISYLLNEISGSFTPFTLNPVFDPPSLYGTSLTPSSYSPNRYYFLGNASLARCRHLQLKVDFGTTSNADEIYNATIFGRIMIET